MNSTTSNTSFYMNCTDMTDHKRDTITISVEEFERLISSENELSSYKKENKELRDDLQTLIEITMKAEECNKY